MTPRFYECPVEGKKLRTERDAVDVIGDAVIPVERLDEDFFRLRAYLEESAALRDFAREANRGRDIWFVATPEELAARVDPRTALNYE